MKTSVWMSVSPSQEFHSKLISVCLYRHQLKAGLYVGFYELARKHELDKIHAERDFCLTTISVIAVTPSPANDLRRCCQPRHPTLSEACAAESIDAATWKQYYCTLCVQCNPTNAVTRGIQMMKKQPCTVIWITEDTRHWRCIAMCRESFCI